MGFSTICRFVVKCLRMRGALCNGMHWVLSILVCMLLARVCCWLGILVCMLFAQYAGLYVRCSISLLVCMLDAPVYWCVCWVLQYTGVYVGCSSILVCMWDTPV